MSSHRPLYNTFDLVIALMLEATGFLAREGTAWPAGVHRLPAEVAGRAARRVTAAGDG